jgi:spore maturation protein CgeB
MGLRIKFGNVGINDYALLHNKALTTYSCSNSQEYIKWRVFEAMSMGCLVLSDKFFLMEQLFTEDVHYLSVKTDILDDKRTALNVDDLYDKIMLCRRNKELTERITRNAFIEVRSKHTYMHRAKMILEKLGLVKQDFAM